MTSGAHCGECGAAIPGDSPRGYCGQCLLNLGLQTAEEQPAAPASAFAPRNVRYFGDYELLEEIARGGMGVVFKARQVSLNRLVAVKLVSAGALATQELVKRFKAEAEAAASLSHPNIVPIYEIGEQDGQHYFSMGLIEGPNLREALRKIRNPKSEIRNESQPPDVGCYEPKEAARLVAAIARAVHYAHQRGVLHRDIKPSNILLDANGEPRLTDFGLAKLVQKESTLTHTNAVMGTPAYMSPEQARGETKDVTTAADVYGLGAVLYETLTGSPPFAGGTSMETIRQVLDQEPRRPSLWNSAVDRDLETIALKCLEKDPAHRYASAAALADDLERWLRREPITARRAGIFDRVVKWAQRQPALAGGVVLLLSVGAAGLTGILWQWRHAVLARRAEAVARERAVRAEADAVARLHEAKLNYVRAQRLSGRPGQRFASLGELAEAATRTTNRLELRNEAIACLVLPDLRPFKALPKTPREDTLNFDPNLCQYMTNDSSGTITIRDVETDTVRHVIPQQGALPGRAIFSPDARLLGISDRGGRAYIWDLAAESACPVEFPTNAAIITFTPDSRALVVKHADGSLHFLNSTNGVEEISYRSYRRLSSMRFNSAGDKFLSVISGAVIVRRTLDGMHLRTIRAPEGATDSLGQTAWHPDGRRIASAWVNNIGLWDAETGRPLGRFVGHESQVTGLAFTRSGEYLASASWDGTTRLWHTDTQGQVLSLLDSGNVLSISEDDRRLSFESWDNSQAKLYELADLSAAVRLTLPPPTRRVRHTAQTVFSPDGELIAAPDNDGVYVFRLFDAAPAAVLPVPDTYTLAFHNDGSVLFTGGANGAQRWPLRWSSDHTELEVGPPAVIPQTSPLSISGIDVSREGDWLVPQGKDKALALQNEPPYKVHQIGVGRMGPRPRISPNGKYVAFVPQSRAEVQIYNSRSGEGVTNLPSQGTRAVAFSADGRWLACSQDDLTTMWDTANWSARRHIPHQAGETLRRPVAFSPQGLLAITFSHREIRLVRFETGEEVATLPGRQTLTSLGFSPSGDRLAAAYEPGYLQIWNLRRVREQLATLKLDWDMPPYLPAKPALGKLRVIVHTNESAAAAATR